MKPDGFRTGDVGFMDKDGWFYLVDRKKDMIVASGFKVWPREVEDVLYSHPDVREVAVVGVANSYRGETVKAFVSLKAGASTTAEDLIAFCQPLMADLQAPARDRRSGRSAQDDDGEDIEADAEVAAPRDVIPANAPGAESERMCGSWPGRPSCRACPGHPPVGQAGPRDLVNRRMRHENPSLKGKSLRSAGPRGRPEPASARAETTSPIYQ